MLTPIVSFATNDTAGDTQAEETNADDTAASDNKTTANTAAAPVEKNGVVKQTTGVSFIDKINSASITVGGELSQEKVDQALNNLIASSTDRRKAAYELATKQPEADSTQTEKAFDSSKVIDGHMYVCESEDYELYVKPSNLSILLRDKKTGTLLRSTLEDEEAYVRSSQTPAFNRITSGVTIMPIKYDPESESRSGMYDKTNSQASSRDAEITYDKTTNGFTAHLNFNNKQNDVSLKGLNIQFDVVVTLDDMGLHVSIPDDTIKENLEDGKLGYMMGDVYLFPLLGYTDRGDTDGYMILPDGNGIIVNFQDFYQDGTAKYKSGYSARVYGTDVSLDTITTDDSSKEREDFNDSEDVIAPYFGMVHDYSAFNDGSHEKDIAVLGFVTSGEYACTIKGNFNGVNSSFENYVFANATYREVYQQPVDNASNSAMTEVTDIALQNLQIDFLLASGDEANYSGLANKTRELLKDKGIITEAKDLDYDVRIDFLGVDKENFLLFRRNVVATTIENIETIVSKLQENGVEDIAAYYDGWQKDGMYNLPNTDFKVDSDLGGNSALKKLSDKYDGTSVSLSLIQDMLTINDTTSNSTFTAMKLINKRTYSYTDRFLNVYKTFKYLTPSKTNEYLKTFADNVQKGGISNISLSGFTDTLSSYSLNSKKYTRKDAMDYYTSAMDEVIGKGMNVSMEEPSMYLWKYTDEYLDMPISSSMYVYTSSEIPFLTSVLKGSMKVYSEYVNFEANQTEFFLKLIETGVYPSFLLTYESPTVLQYTNSSWDYSSDYEQYISVISEFNQDLKAVNEKTEGASIVKHQMNYDGNNNLTKVTYSNGTVVYVNYSEDAVSADGETIDGLSYKVGEE